LQPGWSNRIVDASNGAMMHSTPTSAAVPDTSGDPWIVLQPFAVTRAYSCGQAVYGPRGPAQDWYILVSGAARMCLILNDGHRRIVDFLLPGDTFGFGARNGRQFFVEAIIEPTIVQSFPRDLVESTAEINKELQRAIQDKIFEALARAQARALIVGRVTASEKVLAFLIEMTIRSPGTDRAIAALPMSRYDIADYLAISVETVSRALSSLKRRRVISLVGTRHVKIAIH
jgi:CRP-like cAMP-binding protein